MRALFLMALLLNIAFLYWQYTRDPVMNKSRPVMAPGAELLVMVDEGVDAERAFKSAARQNEESAGQLKTGRAVAAPLKPAPPCLVAGPMVKKQLADRLTRRISKATGAAVTPRQVVVQIQQYWIYLEPAASLSQAQRLAEGLAEHGLKDYQILASPGKKNAISLGLFNEKESAQRRYEQIRDMGYTPRIEVIERVAKRYELLIQPEQGELMQPARIRPLLPKDRTIGVRRDVCA